MTSQSNQQIESLFWKPSSEWRVPEKCREHSVPHVWQLRKRAVKTVAGPMSLTGLIQVAGGGTTAVNTITTYSLRFECKECHSRGVICTSDEDLLWMLDIEAAASAAAEGLA